MSIIEDIKLFSKTVHQAVNGKSNYLLIYLSEDEHGIIDNILKRHSHKTMYSFVKYYENTFKFFGIHCELVGVFYNGKILVYE